MGKERRKLRNEMGKRCKVLLGSSQSIFMNWGNLEGLADVLSEGFRERIVEGCKKMKDMGGNKSELLFNYMANNLKFEI